MSVEDLIKKGKVVKERGERIKEDGKGKKREGE